MLRVRLISRTSYLKKERITTYNNLEKNLRALEQKLQHNYDKNLLGKIKDTKNQINEIVQEELEKRLRFCKQTFYESGPKKILARCLRKQEQKHAVIGIWDPSTGILTHNVKQIQNIFKAITRNCTLTRLQWRTVILSTTYLN